MSIEETHVRELRENGYTRIRQAVSPELTAQLLERIKAIHAAATPLSEENVPFLNRGHVVIYNLQNKDFLFVEAKLRHPLVTNILMPLLNDEWYKQIPAGNPNYILRNMVARSGGPAALPLHLDSFIPSGGSYSWALQVAFVLEDQTTSNGCTIVVPGSHRADRYASQADIDKAVPIESQAGDIVIWDSRIWHGTTANQSGKSRWGFITTFSRWWLKQNYAVTETFPPEFYARLTPAERAVMGYCSMPPRDELERVDLKAGYEVVS